MGAFRAEHRGHIEGRSSRLRRRDLSRIGDKWLVEWRGLAAKFSEAADLVGALAPEQYAAGHQDLDTVTFQFMVSKGVYPPDFAKKTCEPGRD